MSDLFDVSRKSLHAERTAARLGAVSASAPVQFEELPPAPINPSPVVQAVLSSGSAAAEELRVLRAKLRMLDEEKPLRCVGIVSAAEGEGKSTVSLGLVTSLAQEPDRRILLIDCDVRRPALETYLGLPRVAGLAEWLEGTRNTVPLRRIEPAGFYLLSSGAPVKGTPERLGSERMVRLAAAARELFDYVILDCPPLVPVADSVVLQDVVDGFLLVVRARHTARGTILKAVSNLKPDRIRGTIFNGHRDIIPGYNTYGYGGYAANR